MDDSYMSPINVQQNTKMYLDLITHITQSREEGEKALRGKTITNLTMSLRECLGMNY